MRRGRQRGFTLIELMVALVVSALLIGMILSIFTRMSMAYRAQQNVAELQQTLAAAQELVQREVRQAGYQLPDGFRTAAAPTTSQQALQVINNADNFGPDELKVFHADASAQARVNTAAGATNVDIASGLTSITVDDADLFVVGDLAVMVTARRDNALKQANGAARMYYEACVVRLTAIAGKVFALDVAAPWGSATNAQCNRARSQLKLGNPGMLYRFAARAYRIDPARRSMAVLQLSPTGGLVANDWQDLGVGFTDLQVATQWNDYWAAGNAKTTDTADLDTDPMVDWYSGATQDTLCQAVTSELNADLYDRSAPTAIRVTLVVRTIKKIDAVPTSATPALIDAARPNNGDVGDRPAVTLAGVADAARPAELRGTAVFRYATVGTDLRNLAVGQ